MFELKEHQSVALKYWKLGTEIENNDSYANIQHTFYKLGNFISVLQEDYQRLQRTIERLEHQQTTLLRPAVKVENLDITKPRRNPMKGHA